MASLRRKVGRAVREARIERWPSQERLAELAGLDRTYISGLERGVRNPALSTLERIAGALRLRLSDLFRKAERMMRLRVLPSLRQQKRATGRAKRPRQYH